MAFENLLIVDDEAVIRNSVAERFRKNRYSVWTADSITAAADLLRKQSFDFILLDERLPDGSGSQFLETIQSTAQPSPFIVMMSGFGSVEDAVACIHRGAFDFVLKPFSLEQAEIALKRAETFDQLQKVNQFFNAELNQASDLIGNAEAMVQLKKIVRKVAPTAATVLITGENGTGKELVAREIFRLSRLHERPFIKVNCAAMSESLIESEFFGHEKGAFTGATDRRTGRFELANGGTILLDEIGEISPKIQAKLLRVLQEKEFERVGGTRTIRVNTRIIATTNRNLEENVRQGYFREDLFYRLSVFPLKVPPLRERGGDIMMLARAFLERFARKHSQPLAQLSREAEQLLLCHHWPGNVRQLENTIERAIILAEPGEALEPRHFDLGNLEKSGSIDRAPPAFIAPDSLHESPPLSRTPSAVQPEPQNLPPPVPAGNAHLPPAPTDLNLKDLERMRIFEVLTEEHGNRTATAKRLHITTRTLRNKLSQYREAGFTIPS